MLRTHSAINLAVISVAVLSSSPGVQAQLARRGGEFQVNTSSVIDSTGPRAAALPDGGFLVVWDSKVVDGAGSGVLGRRFRPDGEPTGAEFRVSSTTSDNQTRPRLAVALEGSFMVIWDIDAHGVRRQFDPTGGIVGVETAVAEPEVDGFANSVAATTDGDFVVVFNDLLSEAAYSIRARRISSNGQSVAPSFRVSGDDSSLFEQAGAIATATNDSFMVVWYDDARSEIGARHFTDTQPTGPKVRVAEVSSGFVDGPEICGRGTDGFVVTWATYGPVPPDATNTIAYYRRYSAAGEPSTPPLPVALREVRTLQANPVVSCGPADSVTFAWGEDHGVSGRTYANDTTQDFRIRLEGTSRLGARPSLAWLSGDDFVVAWTDCVEPATCGVFAQRYTSLGPVECSGDCDRDGAVTVGELVKAVKIALTDTPDLMRECLPVDEDLDYHVSVNELVAAVHRALGGC